MLFVSHNLQSISTLTQMSVLLVDGKVEFYGSTNNTIRKYLEVENRDLKYENQNISEDNPQ